MPYYLRLSRGVCECVCLSRGAFVHCRNFSIHVLSSDFVRAFSCGLSSSSCYYLRDITGAMYIFYYCLLAYMYECDCRCRRQHHRHHRIVDDICVHIFFFIADRNHSVVSAAVVVVVVSIFGLFFFASFRKFVSKRANVKKSAIGDTTRRKSTNSFHYFFGGCFALYSSSSMCLRSIRFHDTHSHTHTLARTPPAPSQQQQQKKNRQREKRKSIIM